MHSLNDKLYKEKNGIAPPLPRTEKLLCKRGKDTTATTQFYDWYTTTATPHVANITKGDRTHETTRL